MVGHRRVLTHSLYDQGEMARVRDLDTWIVRAGPQGKPPIVFLHGIPTSAYIYREVVRALHEDHDCIAFDWPGFGLSAKPRSLDLTHRARADHLKAVLDHLNVPKAHLVAHDVGGPAAMLFALENPERVDRLALLNTTVFKRDFRPPLPAILQFIPGVREIARPLFARPAFDHFFKAGLAHPERVPKEVLDNHWRLLEHDDGTHAAFDAWSQLPEGQSTIEEIRSRMQGYEGPVLVLFGAEDPYILPPNAERLSKGFRAGDLQMLPDAGHFIQEDAPEEVADRLDAFVR